METSGIALDFSKTQDVLKALRPLAARTTQHTGGDATRDPTCGDNAMQHDDWLSHSQEPAQGNRQHPRSPAQREALDGVTPDEEAPDENLTQPDVNAQLAAIRRL